MRAYWNNSSEFITYKVWILSPNLVTNNNLKLVTSKGIPARITRNDPQIIDHQGYQYSYSGSTSTVEFETTCDEQESMLKLIYGKDLTLLQVNVVPPFTTIQANNYDKV